MRSISIVLLVALQVGSAGCASSYRPVVSPRVQVIRTGSGQAFVRAGQQYDHGLWGEGLADAVADVPAAVEPANTYRNLQIGGFVCSLAGGATLGVGLGAALREARSPEPGDTTTLNVVLLSGAALALLGSLFYMQSEPYLWDAINIHNDSVQRARPQQVPTPRQQALRHQRIDPTSTPRSGDEGRAAPRGSVMMDPMASTTPRTRWGFCPPTPPRSSVALLLSMSLGPLACGDGDGDDGEASPLPAESATDQAAAPSLVSEATTYYDGDDEASSGEPARSRINTWRLSNLDMSSRFVHVYEPPRGDIPAQIFLVYDARDRASNGVHLEWVYDGSALSYDYTDLTVAPSHVGFRDEDAQREWRAVAGNVSLVPGAGRVRVELEGLAIVESFGVEEGPREPLEDGFVEGDVERVCIEYVILDNVPINGNTGLPEPQPQRDEDWSSPFCAQYAE